MNGYGMPDVKKRQKAILPAWKPYPYSIVPMLVLKAEPLSKGIFTYLQFYDQTFTLWCGFFYIKGLDGENILIDSGPSEEDFVVKGFPCEMIKPMPEALKEATGLTPEDIDIVIFTHLHHDHCPLASAFTNAKLIIQEDEWKAIMNPPAVYRALYNREYVENLTPTLVDGDVFNILPGIHLLYTPGHVPGAQSVAVDTEKGRVIICGFCCAKENFYPPEPLSEIWPDALTPGLHVNSEDAFDSVLRVKKEADYIILLHDEETYSRGSCPGPNWPRNK